TVDTTAAIGAAMPTLDRAYPNHSVVSAANAATPESAPKPRARADGVPRNGERSAGAIAPPRKATVVVCSAVVRPDDLAPKKSEVPMSNEARSPSATCTEASYPPGRGRHGVGSRSGSRHPDRLDHGVEQLVAVEQATA